jgi:hypothetical protein
MLFAAVTQLYRWLDASSLSENVLCMVRESGVVNLPYASHPVFSDYSSSKRLSTGNLHPGRVGSASAISPRQNIFGLSGSSAL